MEYGNEEETSEQNRPTFRLELGEFSIRDPIASGLIKFKREEFNTGPINPLNPDEESKIKWSNTIRSWTNQFGVAIAAENELLVRLHEKLVPHEILPVRKARTGRCVSEVSKYCDADKSTLVFDMCPDSCTVFVGANSEMHNCPHCSKERFSPCGHRYCKSHLGQQCAHVTRRTALNSVIYRPLTIIMYQLLKLPGFMKMINFKLQKPSCSEHFRYMDAVDGSTFREAMQEMVDNFKIKAAAAGQLQRPIPVCIVLSVFFDAAQVYKTKTSNFSPLLVGIQNLPPTHRSAIGEGIFLSSLFTGKKESGGERFLLDYCLREELRCLGEGVTLKINGRAHFLQVRLKLHILDTIGLQSYMHFECSNSRSGCPLCGFHGQSSQHVNKCVYGGHREFLDPLHYCRSRGQSRDCCPEGYYASDAEFCLPIKERTAINAHRKSVQFDVRLDKSNHDVQVVDRNKLVPCDKSDVKELKRRLNPNIDEGYVWHHREIDVYTNLSRHLFYHTCDYRAQKHFGRISHQDTMNSAKQAEQVGYSINGMKKVCEIFELPTACIDEDVEFDPAHCQGNVAFNTLAVMKGDRAVNCEGLRGYCEATNTHYPYLQGKGHDIMPYQLPQERQDLVDACIDTILIPSDYADVFQSKQMFQCSGQVRTADIIQCIRVLLNFIFYCSTSDHVQYREYYKMLSSDFTDLSAPCFSLEEIESLHNRVVETVAVHEGLFPISEWLITYHQLMHLPYFIKKWGPLHCWSSMSYERVHASIKRGIPRGGGNHLKTASTRYVGLETERSKSGFSLSGNEDVLLHSALGQLLYDPFRVFLVKQSSQFTLNEFEMTSLVLMLVDQALFKCCGGSWSEAFQKSALVRLYVAFDTLRKGPQQPSKPIKQSITNKNVQTKPLFKKTPHFFLFLVDLQALIRGGSDQNSSFDFERMQEFIVDDVRLSKDDTCQFISAADIEACTEVSATMTVTHFKEAQVYGINIRGRGFQHREIEPSTHVRRYGAQSTEWKPRLPINRLTQFWFYKEHHGSFCQFHHLKPDKGLGFGQVNGYFRLHLPRDELLHLTPIASICARVHDKKLLESNHLVRINLRAERTGVELSAYTEDVLFIPVTQISSTVMLVSGMGPDKLPIRVRSKRLGSRGAKYCSVSPPTDIDNILLLPLHPERRKLTFDFDAFKNGKYNHHDDWT